MHASVSRPAAALLGLALLAPAAFGAPTLLRQLDLSTWQGTPVSPWVPPLPPAPNPGFSLTSLAFDPVLSRLVVADSATANVYLVDTRTQTIVGVSNTQGVTTNAATPTAFQPITVLANPSSGRWIAASPLYGGRFTGTAFSPTDGVPGGTLPSGASWDAFTDIVYAGRTNLFATLNLKYLYGGFPCGGTTSLAVVNPATSRVYAACGLADAPGGLVMFDGIAMQKANKKTPLPPIGTLFTGRPQNAALGLAVNPNTNRLYASGFGQGAALEVFDASTYQKLATWPGLPDQTGSRIVSSMVSAPLPQPVVVDTRTDTVFVLSPLDSSIAVFDGSTGALTATVQVPAAPGVDNPAGELKIGNTVFDARRGLTRTLGGATAMAIDEAGRQLHVATVDGVVLTYALDNPATPPRFSISGTVRDALGAPVPALGVAASGAAGAAAAVTDSQGLFVLTSLPAGTYSVAPSPASGYAAQGVTIADRNAVRLAFAPVAGGKSFTVSVSRRNAGTVTGTPAGLDRALVCGTACSAKFSDGTRVVLTATPPAGKAFTGWSGACSGTRPSCTLTVDRDLSVGAGFSR